jgi:hypothetical protein
MHYTVFIVRVPRGEPLILTTHKQSSNRIIVAQSHNRPLIWSIVNSSQKQVLVVLPLYLKCTAQFNGFPFSLFPMCEQKCAGGPL